MQSDWLCQHSGSAHEYLAKVTRRSFPPKPEVERLARETTCNHCKPADFRAMHKCSHTSLSFHSFLHHNKHIIIIFFQGGLYIRVDNIAPSIHDHREPQRKNKQTTHLAQHTCTHTGTKYKHTSIEHCDKCKV